MLNDVPFRSPPATSRPPRYLTSPALPHVPRATSRPRTTSRPPRYLTSPHYLTSPSLLGPSTWADAGRALQGGPVRHRDAAKPARSDADKPKRRRHSKPTRRRHSKPKRRRHSKPTRRRHSKPKRRRHSKPTRRRPRRLAQPRAKRRVWGPAAGGRLRAGGAVDDVPPRRASRVPAPAPGTRWTLQTACEAEA